MGINWQKLYIRVKNWVFSKIIAPKQKFINIFELPKEGLVGFTPNRMS